MDSDLFDRLIPTLREYLLPLSLGLLGLAFILFGFFSHFARGTAGSIVFEKGEAVEAKQENKTITLDIAGAVLKPGVYTLPSGSRLQDLLIQAGGLSGEADRDRIAKIINLSQVLHDSMKIYIPSLSESQTAVAGASTTSNSLININEASASDLDSLPGVGKVTAEKIIQGRPYEKIEDLVEKKILSASVFEKIKEKVSVY